jgi:hypothetical protein
MTALHWAAFKDDLETSELLVRAGANVKAANRYGVTPLSLACVNGNGEMVEQLLKAGADPNTALPGGETALMTAARTGSLAPVKSLIIRGANVDSRDERRGTDGADVGGGRRPRGGREGTHRSRRGCPAASAHGLSRRCCSRSGKGASRWSTSC